LVEVAGFMALCRVDPASGEVAAEYGPAGRDVDAWSLSADGMLATVENDRGYSVLVVGPRDGERAVVDVPDGVIVDLSWSGDGRLAFALSGTARPSELWIWADGQALPVWEPECALPLQAFGLVEWTSFDGLVVPGWLALPKGEAPAAGWPAVVWVHGGPAMQARANFRSDMQALLAQGYAVLMPNVRGSTGYGRAYMDADDVEKRLDSVHDLAAGREWLVRQPGIDPARIAVMGQSYGGYMVLAAVTEYPDLWRCAIDFYGIADFGTLLAATGPWRRGHRAAEYGDPSRHRALFDRISPIRHFHRVRVPILVLHGTRDPRVGFGESEQVVSALQERRRPVRFEVFEYAGHGFVRPDDKVRVYGAIAAFLGAEL
jgi:dipeptidyl aminopeptidase/acylaminoacyl peptidase